jgi:lipid II:glycine glycyltransferase (peptidoglycan interpeptide bridge formation enzyme)
MPKATVIIDLNQPDDQFYKNLSSNARNHYNKAIRKGLKFQIADEKDWDNFYNLWQQTSAEKGFHIIPKNQFDELKNFLLKTNSGNLFLAKKNDEIVSGSVCLFDNNFIIYLYGATNRIFGNIGAHQFLKIEMFKRGKRN